MEIRTIKQTHQRIEELRGVRSGFGFTPETVAKFYLESLFEWYENAKQTSLSPGDYNYRLDYLARQISQP